VRHDPVFGNNHDAVTNVIKLVIHFDRLAFGTYSTIIANARVLINDGISNLGVFANPQRGNSGGGIFLQRVSPFVIS